jgi:hypothetical protein
MWVVALIGGVICTYFGKEVPFERQWPLYEALRTTASIIFAVIGAWLTILYPNALQRVFSRNSSTGGEDEFAMALMVSNIRLSTAILGLVMVAGLVAQILKQISAIAPYFVWLRAAAFGLLGVLTVLQFWTLLMTLAQSQAAQETITVEAKRKAMLARRNSSVQKDDR